MAKTIFTVDKPEESLGLLLWQTTITWQRLIKKVLEPYQLSHAQFVIMAITLWFESIKQEPTQLLIVNLSKLDKMTVSKALKNLAAAGLIQRTEHLQDTRVKSVSLTAAGKKLITQLVPKIEKIDEQFFGRLEKNSQDLLLEILNQLV